MPARTSRTKTIATRAVGIVRYRVAKVGQEVVDIILDPGAERRLLENGVDLTPLRNIGGRRARKVVMAVLRTVR